MAYELLAGAAIGLAVAAVAVVLMRSSALPSAGLYPVAALAFALTSYAAAAAAGASGFLAVYLTALRLGNAQLPHRRAVLGLSLIHISEPTRLGMISYAVFCLKKK